MSGLDLGAVEDWEQHVTPLLQDMPGHGDEFHFNSQDILVGGQPTTSPVGITGAPSLSPGTQSGGTQPGALSPTGSGSQTSTSIPGLPGSGPGGPGSSSATGCCENGRPIMTDPVSGGTVCSCQYDQARLALSGYPRLGSGPVGVYGTPYPSSDQNPYPSIGVDSSAFYAPLSNPYALKESGAAGDMAAWSSAGLQPTPGYYSYDPALAAYGYGAGYDLAARRKNATRESTATLKAWLNEHKKNPYPTKGEKIMLAIITKMTLTQVSTWFANARRRLKKENKMTWEPKNKTDDDDDAMVSDDEKDKDDMDDAKLKDHKDSMHVKSEHDKDLDDDDDLTDDERKPEDIMGHHPHNLHHTMLNGYGSLKEEITKNPLSSDCGVPIPATKPKIWSLADTAACKTPPPQNSNTAPWGMGGNNGPHGPHQYGSSNHMSGMNMGMNVNMNVNSFALPSTAISPNAPYSRYNGFLGHYNPQNTEIQTDTPPQTPPNMKLPSNVTYNTNNTNYNAAAVGGQIPHHHNNGFLGNSFARLHSPQKERSMAVGGVPPGGPGANHQEFQPQGMMMSNNNQQSNDGNQAAFKPFYKSPQVGNGFVSPV